MTFAMTNSERDEIALRHATEHHVLFRKYMIKVNQENFVAQPFQPHETIKCITAC